MTDQEGDKMYGLFRQYCGGTSYHSPVMIGKPSFNKDYLGEQARRHREADDTDGRYSYLYEVKEVHQVTRWEPVE